MTEKSVRGSDEMPVKKSIMSVLLGIVPVFVMLLLLIAPEVRAENVQDVSLVCSDGKAIAGMHWKIYRAGEKTDSGSFRLTGDFTGYPVNLRDMSAENISGTAKALESFAISSKLDFLREGDTDASGRIFFEALPDGLYLAIADNITIDEMTYSSSPILFEAGRKSPSQDIFPKIYSQLTDENTSKVYTVKKVWVDDGDNIERPVNVTVDLFRDGELYDTVVLDEKNNWYYKWSSLDSSAKWIVSERYIPVNYEVSIEGDVINYIIKNTYPIDVTVDDGGETTTSKVTTTAVTSTSVTNGIITSVSTVNTTTSYVTDTTTGTASTTTTVSTTAEKLPQTGQKWLMVLLLSCGGLILLTVGLLIVPERKDNEK